MSGASYEGILKIGWADRREPFLSGASYEGILKIGWADRREPFLEWGPAMREFLKIGWAGGNP